MKSYTSQAAMALIFYFVFYPVGLVMNLIYMLEARKMQKIAGTGLPGARLLQVMFWLNIGFWVFAIVVGLMLGFTALVPFCFLPFLGGSGG